MDELLGLAVFFVLWIVGMLFGALWFSVFWLPLGYGLPRAWYWAVRGWILWRVLPRYLISPIIWLVIPTTILIGIGLFWPAAYRFILTSSGLNIGFAFGTVIALGRAVLSKSARRDLDEDFIKFVGPYLTPDGGVKLSAKARD